MTLRQVGDRVSVQRKGQEERLLAGTGQLQITNGDLSVTITDGGFRRMFTSDYYGPGPGGSYELFDKLQRLPEQGVTYQSLKGGTQVELRHDASDGSITRALVHDSSGDWVLSKEGTKVTVKMPDGTERPLEGEGRMRVNNGNFELSLSRSDGSSDRISYNFPGSGPDSSQDFVKRLAQLPEAGFKYLTLREGYQAKIKEDPISHRVSEAKINSSEGRYVLTQEGNAVTLIRPDGVKQELGPGEMKAYNAQALRVKLDRDGKLEQVGLLSDNSDDTAEGLLKKLAPEYVKEQEYNRFREYRDREANESGDRVDFSKETPEELAARRQSNADLAAKLPAALQGGANDVLNWLRDFSQQKASLTLPFEQTDKIAHQLDAWAKANDLDVDYNLDKRPSLASLEKNPNAAIETAVRTAAARLQTFGSTFADEVPKSADPADVRQAYLKALPPQYRMQALVDDLPTAIVSETKLQNWMRDLAQHGRAPSDERAAEIATKLIHSFAPQLGYNASEIARQIKELSTRPPAQVFPALFANERGPAAAPAAAEETVFKGAGAFKPADGPGAKPEAGAEVAGDLPGLIAKAVGDPAVMAELERKVPGLGERLELLKGLDPGQLKAIEEAARGAKGRGFGEGAGKLALLIFALGAGLDQLRGKGQPKPPPSLSFSPSDGT